MLERGHGFGNIERWTYAGRCNAGVASISDFLKYEDLVMVGW